MSRPENSAQIQRSGAFWLCLWVILTASLGAWKTEKSDLDDMIEAAIQNPAVREHFRERLTDMSTVTDSIGRRQTQYTSPLEEQVDRLARVFLRKVFQDLQTVELSFQITREQRLDVQVSPAGPARGLQLQGWRSSLRELSEAVKDLRSTVRPLLLAAYRKSMKKGAEQPFDLRSSEGLQRGLDSLEQDLETTLGRVRGFFFETSHTITLSTLAENDLLVALERIETLAQELAGRI